jgi:plasmid stabilization system protein ParE
LGTSQEEDQEKGPVKIRILSPAEDDLEDGYRFYARQAPGLGSYFLDCLYSDIDSLIYFGGIHPVVLGYHRLLSKRFPFAVYYRLRKDVVVVYAVLDCRRNPNWARRRLMED